jgi:hypothetical protein
MLAVMIFKSVSELLQAEGYRHPALKALISDVANYKTMMFQPYGEIEASVNGVFNRDRALAKKQFRMARNRPFALGLPQLNAELRRFRRFLFN